MVQQGDENRDGAAYLLGLTGQLAGRKLILEKGRSVIGRDATRCQIVLDQAVISRQHAAIEIIEQHGAVVLTDLNSSQGTFVNDERVGRRELRDGDRVGFGLGGVVAFTYYAARHATAPAPLSSSASVKPGNLDDLSIPHSLMATILGFDDQAAGPAASGTATTTMHAAHLPLLRIGRASDNDIVLDTPSVSRHHAMLNYPDNIQPVLSDLGSTNGTYVNGELLTEPRALTPQDLVSICGFLIHVDGHKIRRYNLSESRITARNVTKEIAGKTILRDISLAIYPREFVGLMGPSGCGKSTLMDALNGLRPASSGAVLVNDLDLYRNFDALRRSIGYVPQRDILHDALTVERTLYYAAKLRLPEGTSSAGIRKIVDEVIETVGLREQRPTQFRQLSGGQQKRLSLALELITKPNFIFLDEPTSPLDPVTTENMMMLFRKLADQGRIVVMVTHKFEKFGEMHHIAMLTEGGRLAFFGPPSEALKYFDCHEPGEIYRRIGARDPEELSRSYRASTSYRRYVQGRIEETEKLTRSTGPVRVAALNDQGMPGRRFGISQWWTLTRRYLEVKLQDKRNTLLLLAQAPIVAIILAIITGDSLNDAKTLFIAAIISIWFGANNAVREIVSETAIYTRERLVNLKIPSYVFSKFAVLSGIGLIQCILFVGILVIAGRLSTADLFPLTLILYLTLLAGAAMGLFFSALVNSAEKAMSILPLILIPQLLLSGFLKPLDDLYVNARTGRPATVVEYQYFEETKDQPPPAQTANAPVAADPITKWPGLGAARYASGLMVARWSIEGLAHQVSIRDAKAREKLATQMTVAEYGKVLDRQPDAEITSGYRHRVLVNLAVLFWFNILFLAMTAWALKRKDVL